MANALVYMGPPGDKSVLEETASNQLKTAENKLKEIVKQKLEQAIRADDQPIIIR